MISIVLCTYNRADRVTEPIEAALASADQGVDPEVEVVVVDDGSSDATPKVLAGIDDPRVRVARRPNGGLCTARNTGLALVRGDWTIFLDDDDLPEPGWLPALAGPMARSEVGVTCCGGTLVDEKGGFIMRHPLLPLPEPFGHVEGSYLPGTFAARTDLLREAGGYLEGLGAAHQFELFVRLMAVVKEAGLEVAATPEQLILLERRDANDRPVVNPRLLFDGTRWVLARHDGPLASSPQVRADFDAVVAAAAARLSEWDVARRRFWRAARARPTSVKHLGRALLSAVPVARARVWGRHGTWASHDVAEIGVRRQLPPDLSTEGADNPNGTGLEEDGPVVLDGEPVPHDVVPVVAREFFVAWRYHANPPASSDADGTPYWEEGMASSDLRNQVPVYRWGARLVQREGWERVLDVGCGSGQKLATWFEGDTVGVDQGSGIALARSEHPDRRWVEGDLSDPATWAELDGWRPQLTICADVIEHVEDPVDLLHWLARVSAGGPVMLSTPDRRLNDPEQVTGPPGNPRHIREWTADQFELLLLSTGFRVRRQRHLLPRSYSLTRTEFNRTTYRALTLKAVPDRRSCMAWLVEARP